MDTPLMKQYYSIKKRYPDTILFFRVGDFYETFESDARLVSRELNIVLTSRNRESSNVPLAGVPYHAIFSYVSKLIEKGYKVAICEQLEDPRYAKGLVKRDVVRVITPGTIIDEQLLQKGNNYLAGTIKFQEKFGLIFVDISTGELFGAEYSKESETEMFSDLVKYQPSELLVMDKEMGMYIKTKLNAIVSSHLDYRLDLNSAEHRILEHFQVPDLKSIGLNGKNAMLLALDMIFTYMVETQKAEIKILKKLVVYEPGEHLTLDFTTLKNLEIFENARGDRKFTLFGIMDRCSTSMGMRTLKRWIQKPLLETDKIDYRLDGIENLIKNGLARSLIRDILKEFSDLERINNRVAFKNANPRDLINLKNSILLVSKLKNQLESFSASIILDLIKQLHELEDVIKLIDSSISDTSTTIEDGNVIKDGYDEKLDFYRKTKKEGMVWLADIETREKTKTGIRNLKIGYNDVVGYYIEVTNSNLNRVPSHFIRKQTLKNCERFTTKDLQEKEYLIKAADVNILNLEKELYLEIMKKISEKNVEIKEISEAVGMIDVLTNNAELAVVRDYSRPTITEDGVIELKDSKHPILDTVNNEVVPNDVYLDMNNNRFLVITGPNMAGKSTYMRQVALIAIMAQVGSYVSAKFAKIGIVDKIFTRVGASDDILRGQSTFMTEMIELSNILNTSTSRSLIILDEIGRGTSTFDGLSIAWAVSEHIHNRIRARTMFATHYHQLIDLEKFLEGIKNYHILVKDTPEGLIFVRKVVPGGMNESYGIEVAKLAGIPQPIIDRAKQVLEKIEKENILEVKKSSKTVQTALFSNSEENEILKELGVLDPNKLSPIEALNKLNQLKKKLQG